MRRQVFDPPHLLKHLPVPNFHWGRKQNGFCFLAGQCGIAHDGTVPASLADQSRLALASIDETLTGLGASNEDIVQMMLFFVLSEGQKLSEVFTTFVHAKDELWPNCAPAGTAVPVSELVLPGLLLEVQVVAAAPQTT